MSDNGFQQNQAKKMISKYASKAKHQIQLNTILLKEIKEKKEEVIESKSFLQKISQYNGGINKIKNIKNDLREFNEKIQKKNIALIKERQALREKVNKLY